MSSTVTLEVINGPAAGQKIKLGERTRLIVGRDPDCTLQVPHSLTSISRHHCVLEVGPPHITVRDLGSLNGSFINQKCVGHREKNTSPEEGAQLLFPDHPLQHGDELRLGTEGQLTLRVRLFASAQCTSCDAELQGLNRFELGKGVFQCDACRKVKAPAQHKPGHCPVCDNEVPLDEDGIVCSKCSADKGAMARHLMELAQFHLAGLNALRQYKVVRKIGEGGFGVVYLARHLDTDRRVALKVMLPQMAADAKARLYFEREIENTKALTHSNVVGLFEHGCTKGIHYFTMDYCDSGNITDLMKRRGGVLEVREALFLFFQALDGLQYAHQAPIPRVRLADGSYKPGRGLVHRDIKPPNLLLHGIGASRVVKVSDYGLAKAFDKAGLSGLTGTDESAGSCAFMPRQQVSSFGEAQPEVDVWAMAATLYFMLTGCPPRNFKKGTHPLKVVLQCPVVPIGQRDPRLPKSLAKAIDEALIEDPDILVKDVATLRRRIQRAANAAGIR